MQETIRIDRIIHQFQQRSVEPEDDAVEDWLCDCFDSGRGKERGNHLLKSGP